MEILRVYDALKMAEIKGKYEWNWVWEHFWNGEVQDCVSDYQTSMAQNSALCLYVLVICVGG